MMSYRPLHGCYLGRLLGLGEAEDLITPQLLKDWEDLKLAESQPWLLLPMEVLCGPSE